MIGLMERSAAALVHPLLSDSQATVGFEVCVACRQRRGGLATPGGRSVSALMSAA
jgi:hypothetical protein